MEHRNGSRIAISIPVELMQCGTSYGRFTSINIGHGGVLVNCPGILKKGDFLTVKIADIDETSSRHHFLKVMVVHSSERGVGLMWADYNIPFFNALDFMLSDAAA